MQASPKVNTVGKGKSSREASRSPILPGGGGGGVQEWAEVLPCFPGSVRVLIPSPQSLHTMARVNSRARKK